MLDATRPLAVVTGASTGIGFELARQCAQTLCRFERRRAQLNPLGRCECLPSILKRRTLAAAATYTRADAVTRRARFLHVRRFYRTFMSELTPPAAGK